MKTVVVTAIATVTGVVTTMTVDAANKPAIVADIKPTSSH